MVQGMVACMGAAAAQPPLPLQGMALFGVKAWWCQWRDQSGRWFFGFWEKKRVKKMGGKCFFFPCSLRVQGEEEALWCRSKRHCLLFSLFFLVCNKTHETTLFGPKHAVYLNKNWRQNGSNFRLALQFARFFTMVLGFGFLQSSP